MTKSISIQLVALMFVAQAAFGQLGTVYAVASGDSVSLWNSGIEANCAARFVFDVGIMPDSLRVVERDTSTRLMTCTCGFGLSVTVAHLQPGSYVARVYRSHVAPSYTIYYVGSATFIIQGPSGGQTSYRGFQSNCSPNAVGTGPSLVTGYSLGQNYPNPFNPKTSFEFSVPSGRDLAGGGKVPSCELVTLKVFDLLGREAATLANEVKQPGTYTVQWDASRQASGVYFYRLSVAPLAPRDLPPAEGRDEQAGGFTETRKMILVK